MKETTIDQTLVLCDLDSLLLDAAGNLPQLQRDVLQLFASRGGRLTVFSQRSPRAVRSLLGGVRLSAPALVCGGTLAYNFSEGSGTALCSFEGMEESVLKKLPSLSGVGIALQMRDGSTRAVRMSEGLVFHLKQEWTHGPAVSVGCGLYFHQSHRGNFAHGAAGSAALLFILYRHGAEHFLHQLFSGHPAAL